MAVGNCKPFACPLCCHDVTDTIPSALSYMSPYESFAFPWSHQQLVVTILSGVVFMDPHVSKPTFTSGVETDSANVMHEFAHIL